MKRLHILPLLCLIFACISYNTLRGTTPLMKIAISHEDSLKISQYNETRQITDEVTNDVQQPYLEGNSRDSILMIQLDSINFTLTDYSDIAREITPVRIALLLNDIYGKKEMEFSKGFILGINKLKLPANSVSLKMINGEIPEDSLQWSLAQFLPDLIFTTQDNGASSVLTDYAGEHNTKIINVFDTKSENYTSSPSMVQVLIPSHKFNVSAAVYLASQFEGDELIMVGEPQETDGMLKEILNIWPGNFQTSILRDDIETFSYNPDKQYVFYITAGSNDEIRESLGRIKALQIANPNLVTTVIGRPNWVAFNDLKNNIAGLDVYIPSKCYIDVTSEKESRWYIPEYKNLFGNAPIKSYPVYSIMGYDVASYFIPREFNELNNIGSDIWNDEELLQLNISLANDSWSSGQYNAGSYMLHFDGDGQLVKIPMKAE